MNKVKINLILGGLIGFLISYFFTFAYHVTYLKFLVLNPFWFIVSYAVSFLARPLSLICTTERCWGIILAFNLFSSWIILGVVVAFALNKLLLKRKNSEVIYQTEPGVPQKL